MNDISAPRKRKKPVLRVKEKKLQPVITEQATTWRLRKPSFKQLGFFAGTLVILIILLNFSFFWQNLKYSFVQPKTISSEDLLAEKPKVKIEPNIIIIDSLGLKLPVIYQNGKTEDEFQTALQSGVVHYPGTAKPGEYGNVYIFGHSSDNVWAKGSYKTAFALLPRIEKGAEIIISDWNGNPYKYKVTDTRVVNADDLSVLDQRKFEKRLLTLQTSYPIGTALKRYIVVAEIQEPQTTEPLPQIGT